MVWTEADPLIAATSSCSDRQCGPKVHSSSENGLISELPVTPARENRNIGRHSSREAGKLDLKPTEKRSFHGTKKLPAGARSLVVVSVWLFLVLHPLAAQEIAMHRLPVKILQRFLAPFRSNPFSQSSMRPCRLGLAACFSSASTVPSHTEIEYKLDAEDSDRPLMLELRADHGGPFAHHWLEVDGAEGGITIGFGPATLPFIDSGEVSLEDRYGNTKWISGMHPLPWLALPPIKYRFAGSPGEGRIIGKPIPLTAAQSEALTRKLQHLKFVGPYIPIFHDCRTFSCAVLASSQGHSTLPCYLMFKGHW